MIEAPEPGMCRPPRLRPMTNVALSYELSGFFVLARFGTARLPGLPRDDLRQLRQR